MPPNPLQPSADRCTAPLLRHCVALCGAAFRLCGFAADEQVCRRCVRETCEPNLSARADAFVLSSVAHRPRLPSAEGFVCLCVGTAGCDELEQEHQAAADGHSLFPRREARTGQQRRLAEYSPPECPLLSSPFLAARADYPSGQHLRFADAAAEMPSGGQAVAQCVVCGMRNAVQPLSCDVLSGTHIRHAVGDTWNGSAHGPPISLHLLERKVRELCSLPPSQGLH